MNAIVAREDNKDSKKIQELKAAFQTSEVAEKRRKSTKATRSKAGKPEPAPSLPTAPRYPRPRERSSNQIKTGAPGRRHHANRQLCGGKRQPGNDIRPSKALAPASIQAGSNTR